MTLKKRPLTLIEVCIALSLTGVVVYMLFSSLIQTARISTSLNTIKAHALETSYCYNRLLPIFSRTDSSSFTFEKDGNGAISSLDFSFENGLDPALIFSGDIKASIHVDQKHNLILDLYAKDGSSIQSEILLTNVDTFSWKPTLPFFLTLEITRFKIDSREFVFFFSNRPETQEAYPI